MRSVAPSQPRVAPPPYRPTTNGGPSKASLQRFGERKPIVVDSRAVVIAGNGALEAARQLGWESVEIVRTELNGADRKAEG